MIFLQCNQLDLSPSRGEVCLCSLPLEPEQICDYSRNDVMWLPRLNHKEMKHSTCGFSWDTYLWTVSVHVRNWRAQEQEYKLIHTQRPHGEALRPPGEREVQPPTHRHTASPALCPLLFQLHQLTDGHPRNDLSQNTQPSYPQLPDPEKPWNYFKSHDRGGGCHSWGTKNRQNRFWHLKVRCCCNKNWLWDWWQVETGRPWGGCQRKPAGPQQGDYQ